MATKVTMYKAKDGSLHETPGACDAKNVELRLAPAIEKFVNGLSGSAVGLTNATPGDATGAGFYIQLADLPTFLIAHSDDLRKVLNDALVVKKPRKAVKGAAPTPTPPADAGPGPTVADTPPAANDDSLSDVLKALG